MSKLSYFFIAVIVTALLFMGAVRGYEFYAQQAAQSQTEREIQAATFSFQNVPLQLAAPQAEPVSRPVLFRPQNKQDIFLEDAPLTPQSQVQQAQDTIQSILEDYKNEPQVRAFNQELKNATQGKAVGIASLSGADLGEMIRQNPQVGEIVSKYMQNPEFAKIIEQIFSNPEFIQSIAVLQQNEVPMETKKAAK